MSSTAIAERPQQPNGLAAQAKRFEEEVGLRSKIFQTALPPHVDVEKFKRNLVTAVIQMPKLLEVNRASLFQAAMSAASLGLMLDKELGHGYILPFWDSKTKREIAQFIPGYKGLLTLARNSGQITSVKAVEIKQNDKFDFDMGSDTLPSHTFDISKPRGDTIAFWAFAHFTDGGHHWELMSVEEIMKIRDRSNGWKAAVAAARKYGSEVRSPWATDFGEMGKKTVIRRMAKYLPLSVQRAAALDAAYDTGRPARIEDGELVIDAEDPSDAAPQIDSRPSRLEVFEASQTIDQRPEHDSETGEFPVAIASPPTDLLGHPAQPDFWDGDLVIPSPAAGSKNPDAWNAWLAKMRVRIDEARRPDMLEDLRHANLPGITKLRDVKELSAISTTLGLLFDNRKKEFHPLPEDGR